ncbi:hypothetical protein K435DRAFT_800034 [Dendrothele bispora CBS 962.96]|uniref:Uncharacterized protein n=1 Tax=Dendrothele bispora (strain CBS 962.96) TaxID=1314807 RepID=A0A4S8LUK4_DENBC|nr:hypothetical protein K435DRAFT_809639 [Dendrothele bispora CBS 962.96]THU93001.1 hypothetical protein K435DRAFT_800034 [Dendrothele bispora CBS 962.96]
MSPSTTPSRSSKGKAPALALRASPTLEPPALEANQEQERFLARVVAPGPRLVELEEEHAPPNATRQERSQIMHANSARFDVFMEADAAWEQRNRDYEAAMVDLEQRMADWVEEWKEEFRRDREERKEMEEERKRKEAEEKRVARLAEADQLREQQQVAGSSGIRTRTPPVPTVEIRKKRKVEPSLQSKICDRCIAHKIWCCPQEKGRTLACQACHEAKARCSLTEPAWKCVKSAPEVDDNEDASYALNLFAGDLTTKVQEMDKKIDENRTTAFRQYTDSEEQNHRLIGLIKTLMNAIGVDIPPELMTDSEDEGEEEDDGKGGLDGFFDFEAIEVEEDEVRKEKERAGANADEEDDDDEEEKDQ